MQSPQEQATDLPKELVELSLLNLHICVTSHSEIDIKDIIDYITSVVLTFPFTPHIEHGILQHLTSVQRAPWPGG